MGGDLLGKYKEIYDSSITEKENLWKEVAENIFWYVLWKTT